MFQMPSINKMLLKTQDEKQDVLSLNGYLPKSNTRYSLFFLKQSNRTLVTNVSKRDSSYYTDKDKVVSITYEEIGLFPRSFSRVLDRFLKQLFSDVDNLVIQEYRFYRYLFLTTIKTIFILFFVPFLVNFAAKNYVVKPITEFFWNKSHPEIFLNSYQQKRAFAELEKFEEKIYFETLVESHSHYSYEPFFVQDQGRIKYSSTIIGQPYSSSSVNSSNHEDITRTNVVLGDVVTSQQGVQTRKHKDISKLYQEKTIELATYYNNHSIEAITNFFADLLSLCTLLYLLITLEIQINITKSFLLEVFFGLDDSKKSLLILLITDLLVGYHSSNLWELFFEFLFNHYGIPESQTGIFLLVATLPVLLDVLFKYLIFRHLNRSSPATVATYQAIIE
nr:chloroplast enveloppe membrane protein [Eudorina elegans]